MPELEEKLEVLNGKWSTEEHVYRLFHQSFKVFRVQDETLHTVALLRELSEDRKLNPWFEQIISEGTGKEFELSHNANWLATVRPMMEALFYAKYFMELVIKCGKLMETAEAILPSGWAAVLCLYNQR